MDREEWREFWRLKWSETWRNTLKALGYLSIAIGFIAALVFCQIACHKWIEFQAAMKTVGTMLLGTLVLLILILIGYGFKSWISENIQRAKSNVYWRRKRENLHNLQEKAKDV